VAFTASYLYDPWWIERHPQDTQRVALRAHDGSFLASCGKSSYAPSPFAGIRESNLTYAAHAEECRSSVEDEEVRLVEGSPHWWYVRYLREEPLSTFESDSADNTGEKLKADKVREMHPPPDRCVGPPP
jgi:hypothetical protein